jgi:hypothetical protein
MDNRSFARVEEFKYLGTNLRKTKILFRKKLRED